MSTHKNRRAKQLEDLIMEDFNRMLEVQSRAEKKLYFSRMCDHVRQRSPEQVKRMELAKGLSIKISKLTTWFRFGNRSA